MGASGVERGGLEGGCDPGGDEEQRGPIGQGRQGCPQGCRGGQCSAVDVELQTKVKAAGDEVGGGPAQVSAEDQAGEQQAVRCGRGLGEVVSNA